MSVESIWKLITVEQPWIIVVVFIVATGTYVVIKRVMRKRRKRMAENPLGLKKSKSKKINVSFDLNEGPPSPPKQGFSRDIQKNAVDEIKNKTGRIRDELLSAKEKLSSDLVEVKQIKEEIYVMVNSLRDYYKELNAKEELLKHMITDLGGGEVKKEKKRLL